MARDVLIISCVGPCKDTQRDTLLEDVADLPG
jgi:hypothetical protein